MSTEKNSSEKIQDKKNLEQELSIYRSLVENSPDLFYRTDLNGLITYISPSVFELSGYSVDEAVGMNMAAEIYMVPEERIDLLNLLRENGKVTNFTARLKRKDGTIWWASTNARLFTDEKGDIAGVEGITRDISELKEKEKALQESETRFRTAFHTNPDSINLNRVSDGYYLDINQGFTELTGYTREDVIGKSSLAINIWKDPADRKRLVEQLISTGQVTNMDAQFVKKNGEVGDGLMSARIIKIGDEDYIQSVTKEITDKKRLQRQVLQYQRLEAIGTLASGIAHDFNNLIGAILNYAQLILNKSDQSGVVKNFTEKIISAGDRASNLVQQLMDFSRSESPEKTPIDVSSIANEAFKLIKASIAPSISFEKNIAHETGKILANSDQIHQVIINLCINASQAMKEKGGQLVLNLKNANIDDSNKSEFQSLSEGKYLSIEVSDTGSGMDIETMTRIFEPFFTTKEKGIGTGMGLATVHGIVKSHNGEIRVESELGSGSTFEVLLPLIEDE